MAIQWHLKKYDDGSVFGPVPLETLKDWSSKGEISPYDMLSPDGVKWMAAPELPDLEMNWIVEFPDGEAYGPTCIAAIRTFLEDGQLSGDNTIRHAETGETSLIREHPAFEDLFRDDSPSGETSGDAAEVAGEAAAAEEQDTAALVQRIAELEEENDRLKSSLETAHQELVTSKTQQQFLRSELELIKETARAAQAKKKAESDLEEELAKIREQFNLLFEINKELTHHYEVSVAQLNRKIQETMGKIEENARREEELNRQVAEAAQREAHYREQIIALEKEVVKTEQAQAKLLEKFSELNDRLMQHLERSRVPPANPGR